MFFVTAWPSGFESKKQAGFVQMSRLLEFDAPHRMRKAAKYGQKPTFFERNGSRLSSYVLIRFLICQSRMRPAALNQKIR